MVNIDGLRTQLQVEANAVHRMAQIAVDLAKQLNVVVEENEKLKKQLNGQRGGGDGSSMCKDRQNPAE